jgi:hypothetical protein
MQDGTEVPFATVSARTGYFIRWWRWKPWLKQSGGFFYVWRDQKL